MTLGNGGGHHDRCDHFEDAPPGKKTNYSYIRGFCGAWRRNQLWTVGRTSKGGTWGSMTQSEGAVEFSVGECLLSIQHGSRLSGKNEEPGVPVVTQWVKNPT